MQEKLPVFLPAIKIKYYEVGDIVICCWFNFYNKQTS
jgi:hypothetical protein